MAKMPAHMRQLTDEEVETVARRAADTQDEPVWMLANELMQIRQRSRGGVLNATTLVSARTSEPRVSLSIAGGETQMSPAEARAHARAMMEAANTAEMDAFLVSFLHDEVGLPREKALGALTAMRRYRERLEDASRSAAHDHSVH